MKPKFKHTNGKLPEEKWIKINFIKFCVKNEIKFTRTFEMFTVAFGVSIMSRTQIQLWYNGFREGREDVKDDARQQPMKTLKQ